MADKDKPLELNDSNGPAEKLSRRRRSEPMDPEARERSNRLRARGSGKPVRVDEVRLVDPQPTGLVDPNRPVIEVMRCSRCGKPIQAKASPDFDTHTRMPIGRFNYLCGECTARGIENGTIKPWQVVKLF